MKILILNYEWPPLGGGGGPVAQRLAVGYAERGHTVDVFTTRFRGQPKCNIESNCTIHRVWAPRKKKETCETPEMIAFVIAAFIPVLRWCLSAKPDVIHCHFAVPTGLLAMVVSKLTGIPYLLTCHGSDIPGYNPHRFTWMHRLTPPIIREVLRHATFIVSPSHYLADFIKHTFPTISCPIVIPNGLDHTSYSQGPKTLPPRILMAGRLLHRKGFADTLLALKGIEHEFEVHIAGDGPQREELQCLANQLRQPVVFHGWLSQGSFQLNELFATSSIFCMPSQKENASVSLLEAMASGTAIITSDTTGCRETVRDGQLGIMVSPGDVSGIRAAMENLLTDPQLLQSLQRRALQGFQQCYDVQVGIEYYLQLLGKASEHIECHTSSQN